jgi:hypothetical protein
MADGKSLLVAGNDRTAVGAWIVPIGGAPRRLNTGDLVINGAFGYDIAAAARARRPSRSPPPPPTDRRSCT